MKKNLLTAISFSSLTTIRLLMKTINTSIAAFAIIASMTACSEEEIAAVTLAKDTLAVISSFTVDHSNGGYGGTAIYKVNHDANGRVSSVDFQPDEWTAAKNIAFSWSADHRVLSLDKTQTGTPRDFYFNADSTLYKVVTTDGNGTKLVRTFELEGKRVLSITDVVGDMIATHIVNYTDNGLAAIDYYDATQALSSQLTATVANEVNPIVSMKNPELLAIMYEYEMNEAWMISHKKLTKTNWGIYQNWDMSYEYNAKGDLSKIVRADNVDPDYPRSSDIKFEYKEIIK